MTDERLGSTLFDVIMRLPKGAGIVFRHYSLPLRERMALFKQIKKIARKRGLMVVIGGTTHGRNRGAITAPVHTVPQRVAAERAGAQLIFVSPVFATRSHSGATPLGRVRFGMLIRQSRVPVIALGGMTADRARSLSDFGIYGWAAIEGLSV